MKAFYGRIGRRLPDAQGQVRFTFVHASGAILELKIGPGGPLPREHQRVIAMGDLVGPGVIVGHEIQPDGGLAAESSNALND